MNDGLPLPTLLSHALVAFTIEFDNEFEHRMPHTTTKSGIARGPWLVSMVMWSNTMRLIGEQGITERKLEKLARTKKLALAGLERWGYISVAPDPADSRAKPPRADWVIRPTLKGRRAQEIWQSLFTVIETRWETRFGNSAIEALRESLSAVLAKLNVDLPEYLPVLGYGFISEVISGGPNLETKPQRYHLPALLSKVLLAFTLEFESGSRMSLPIYADVMRLVGDSGVRVRDLPRLSGVSKEAIQMALGVLEKRRLIVVEPDPEAARTKLIRLTPRGHEACEADRQRLETVEKRWQASFDLLPLRASLERLSTEQLFSGLEPYPEGWRAVVRKPETLPDHPMVLHRGGYPDGS